MKTQAEWYEHFKSKTNNELSTDSFDNLVKYYFDRNKKQLNSGKQPTHELSENEFIQCLTNEDKRKYLLKENRDNLLGDILDK